MSRCKDYLLINVGQYVADVRLDVFYLRYCLCAGISITTMQQQSESDVQQRVMQTQSNLDAHSALNAYELLLKQLSRHLNRPVYHPNVLCLDSPERVEIRPATMNKLLHFLERKKTARGDLSQTTAQQFKSAAKKFRIRNKFDDFTKLENDEFKTYIRGLCNEISAAIRAGHVELEAGKRHLKFDEYINMALECFSNYSSLCFTKYGTELHLYVLLCWNLCARSDTTAWIHTKHIKWDHDSLKIGIAKSKRNYSSSAYHPVGYGRYLR